MNFNGSKILVCFCLLFILGVLIYSFLVNPKTERVSQYYDQKVDLTGIIIAEPEKRINQQKFEFKAEKIPAKILVTVQLYPEYNYGDKIKLSGKLREPTVFEDFDYRAYLAKEGIYLVSYYPEVRVIDSGYGNWFLQKIQAFKNKMRLIIEANLLPPHSAILKAAFLGDRHSLSDQFKEKLNLTGTRHIVAISGLHIVIWSQLILYLALMCGLWRNQAFYLVLVVLSLYICLIGAPVSAIRAGIMAGILLLAQKLGRLRGSGRAIVFAASVMLLFNPWLLKDDVGFQLSFAATLGIAYLKPILDEKLVKIPEVFHLRDILTMTLSAQLGVLGILVYHFGQLSLISPLANFLIVPFLPAVIILGILLVVSGLIWIGLAKIAVIPLWILLDYIVKVIDYFSGLSFVAYQVQEMSIFILVAYYLILSAYLWQKHQTMYLYA